MADISAKDIMMLRNKTSAGIALCKEALEESGGDMEKAVQYINARSDVVSRIYNLTGAKIGLIKLALKDAKDDFEKAVELIKERGWEGEVMDEDGDKEGGIGVYVHNDRKTVATVKVECLTDFVANNEKFVAFINELAIQAAAVKPEYVSREQVPQETKDEMEKLFKRELEEEGKPEKIWDQIVEGKFNKYYQEKCLLEQKWFKDDSKTIQNLLDEAIGQLGESLEVKEVQVITM